MTRQIVKNFDRCLPNESSIMKVHWVEFVKRIWPFRLDVRGSFESRAIGIPADHFACVRWFGKINARKIYFPSISRRVTNFAAPIPSFELSCKWH